MMKKKKIMTIGIFVALIIAIGWFVFQHNRYNGSTFESRELILNESNKGAFIVSESPIDNYIISEIANQRGQYGYAVFEPMGKGNYKLQTKVWRQKDSVITGFIGMNGNNYEIFMYNKPNLDYVEVSYTDNTLNKKYAIKKLKLIDGRFAITKAPDLKSYSRSVVFYDVNGNKYE